jgi:anti-sigma factor RsiW
MNEISRDVILDLLPLYIADEASQGTRELVEAYLESDPELARVANRLSKTELLRDIPIPITKEHEMEAYQEAKLQQRRYIITLVAIVAVILLFLMAAALAGLFLLIPRIWL